MLEVDCAIMTPHDVLKTSGHVDRFADFMVSDSKTGEFYRADHVLEARLEKMIKAAKTAEEKESLEAVLAKVDGYSMEQLQEYIAAFSLKSDNGNDFGPVKQFNLMFGTEIGPSGNCKAFMRPETAQGQFVNFKRLLECNNDRMPFASAMIGRSFRNEISPRSGLLRVR
jgi:glycyl-tRNA synthetase